MLKMCPFWDFIRSQLRAEAGLCCMETPTVWTTVTDRRVRAGGVATKRLGLLTDVQTLRPPCLCKGTGAVLEDTGPAPARPMCLGKSPMALAVWHVRSVSKSGHMEQAEPNCAYRLRCPPCRAAVLMRAEAGLFRFSGEALCLALPAPTSPSGVCMPWALPCGVPFPGRTHSSWRASAWLSSQTWEFGCCEP